MKAIILFTCLLFNSPDPSLIILDKALKKPIETADGFTLQQFLQKTFPVYATDRTALIDACNRAARMIEKGTPCFSADTIAMQHSMLVLSTDCDDYPKFSVVLTTSIPEINTSFNMQLLTGKEDKRKAQQKLIDFASYLNP